MFHWYYVLSNSNSVAWPQGCNKLLLLFGGLYCFCCCQKQTKIRNQHFTLIQLPRWHQSVTYSLCQS